MLRRSVLARFGRFLVVACALAMAAASNSSNAVAGMTDITITVTNTSVFDHTYDFKDEVGGREWRQPLAAGKSIPVSLTSNQSLNDGYGKLKWRQDGSGVWTESVLLRHGEKISL